jgi:hypothetical protein
LSLMIRHPLESDVSWNPIPWVTSTRLLLHSYNPQLYIVVTPTLRTP